MMLCAIWYHLHNLKNVKNQWRSVTFGKIAGKLYKWYQITLNVSHELTMIVDFQNK